jgi:hypothetical protein
MSNHEVTVFGDARNLIPLFVFMAIVLVLFVFIMLRSGRARVCPACGQRALRIVAQRRAPDLETGFECSCGARFTQTGNGPLQRVS